MNDAECGKNNNVYSSVYNRVYKEVTASLRKKPYKLLPTTVIVFFPHHHVMASGYIFTGINLVVAAQAIVF